MKRMNQSKVPAWRQKSAALAALLLAATLVGCGGPDRDRNSAIGDTSHIRRDSGTGIATAPGIGGRASTPGAGSVATPRIGGTDAPGTGYTAMPGGGAVQGTGDAGRPDIGGAGGVNGRTGAGTNADGIPIGPGTLTSKGPGAGPGTDSGPAGTPSGFRTEDGGIVSGGMRSGTGSTEVRQWAESGGIGAGTGGAAMGASNGTGGVRGTEFGTGTGTGSPTPMGPGVLPGGESGTGSGAESANSVGGHGAAGSGGGLMASDAGGVDGAGSAAEAGTGGAAGAGGPTDRRAGAKADGGQGSAGGAGTGKAGGTAVPFVMRNGAAYADAARIAGLIGFRQVWSPDGTTLYIGDHDPVLVLSAGSSRAIREERPLEMGGQAIKAGNGMLVPAAALRSLFHGEAGLVIGAEAAALLPPGGDGKTAGFGGDRAGRGSAGSEELEQHAAPSGGLRTLSRSADILDFAREFMGVPYEFGAGDYRQSRRFDCSSFTQYVFDRHGIRLPRTARAQGEHGKLVDRDELRPGDLMFFYVPGRFRSNLMVGHVAIYMGGGKMIHSSPLPEDGVQITPIDKEFWRDTFLFAKRYL